MPSITEISQSILVPSLIKDPFVRGGQFELRSNGNPVMYSGGFTSVYPFTRQGQKWAFRCWHSDLGNVKQRLELISKAISQTPLPYFCEFAYVDEGIVVDGKIYPTTRMRWIDGLNLKDYICAHRDKETLQKLAKDFLAMCKDLHTHHFAHGDLQHENIIVSNDGRLFLIDYDSMYVPQMNNFSDIITGKKDYQHPRRADNHYASEKLDYFSELIIYLSILAISEDLTLIDTYQVPDSEGLLFTFKDFLDIQASAIYKQLSSFTGIFPQLLKVLELYLEEKDINKLTSFDLLLEKWSKRPVVRSFKEIHNGKLYEGDMATLQWEVSDADTIIINNQAVSPGETSCTLAVPNDKKFTLEASNGLHTISASIEVYVYPQPDIQFTASNLKLREGKGEQSMLSWKVTHASAVALCINGQSNSISSQGNQQVCPDQTTDYTLVVIGMDEKRTIQQTINIRVCPESLITFTTDKTFVVAGVPALLKWEVKNALSSHLATFINGKLEQKEKVHFEGSKMVAPTQNTTYRLLVMDEFQESFQDIDIQLLPLPTIKAIMVPTPIIEKQLEVNVHTTILQASVHFPSHPEIPTPSPPSIPLVAPFQEEFPSVELKDMHTLQIRLNDTHWWNRITANIQKLYYTLSTHKQ